MHLLILQIYTEMKHLQKLPTMECKRYSIPNKNCSRRHLIFYFYLSKKIKLDFSCESSARLHLKHQVLFSLKNKEKIFMNVVCCRDGQLT